MNLSDEGKDFIKAVEECCLDSYQDQGGVWTVGWGHTGPDIVGGMLISQDQANAYFETDAQKVEKCVNNSVSRTLTQNQFDALCSFVFNLGCIALRNSTLLRKLNAGDDVGASEEFKKWDYVHIDGKPMQSQALLERRAKETAIFLT